jgi:hypothetical protein
VANEAREFFVRLIDAMNAHDLDAAEAMVHPDFVAESHQSGERSRGREGFRAQLRDYPGVEHSPITLEEAEMFGDEERWAVTPGYTVVPLKSGNQYTVVFRSRYPDGSSWRMVLLVQLRDNLLYRMEPYYAPEMSAPLQESIAAWGRARS